MWSGFQSSFVTQTAWKHACDTVEQFNPPITVLVVDQFRGRVYTIDGRLLHPRFASDHEIELQFEREVEAVLKEHVQYPDREGRDMTHETCPTYGSGICGDEIDRVYARLIKKYEALGYKVGFSGYDLGSSVSVRKLDADAEKRFESAIELVLRERIAKREYAPQDATCPAAGSTERHRALNRLQSRYTFDYTTSESGCIHQLHLLQSQPPV
jgi:hypothetical protein